jgi:Tol biopolymer transport system component
MSVAGDDVAYLGEFGHHPMWTPDGQGIIAYVIEDDAQHLVRYPLDGSPPRVFLENLPGVHGSLDRAGQRLVTDVFGPQAPGEAHILLVDVARGERTVLASGTHERHDHLAGSHPHPQWSRDESRIFFNMADTGVPQLYAVAL